jgi:hypothetical protein
MRPSLLLLPPKMTPVTLRLHLPLGLLSTPPLTTRNWLEMSPRKMGASTQHVPAPSMHTPHCHHNRSTSKAERTPAPPVQALPMSHSCCPSPILAMLHFTHQLLLLNNNVTSTGPLPPQISLHPCPQMALMAVTQAHLMVVILDKPYSTMICTRPLGQPQGDRQG